MQVTTNYKNWLIAINRTGNNTVVQAYSKTVPVKQVTADTEDLQNTVYVRENVPF